MTRQADAARKRLEEQIEALELQVDRFEEMRAEFGVEYSGRLQEARDELDDLREQLRQVEGES